jgi:phosphate uptake regulator
MRRKVIQIANSTQLISLPRKWALKHGVKKGSELDVSEQGNKVVIYSDTGAVLNKVELNITNLDRSSILYYIRSVYRLGYDEIEVRFDNSTTVHYRMGKKVNTLSVIHEEVNRLVGIEIIKQTENLCVIKNLTPGSIKEFEVVLRRIFLLLKDANEDLTNGIKKKDLVLLETIEQKHDTITKFASYCLRLLNKYGYPDSKNTTVIYHIIITLDKIMDLLKYASRDALEFKINAKKETKNILDGINYCIHFYADLFYKFEVKPIKEFMNKRDDLCKMINLSRKKISPDELKLVSNMQVILEILIDLIEARMALEY